MPVTVTTLQATIGADDTELVKAVQRMEASFQKMGASIVAAFEKSSNEVKADLEKVEGEAKKVAEESGNALTKGFNKAWASIGEGTMRTGKNLSLFVTAPLLLLGKHALDVAGGFEQSMQILQVTAGASGDQMAQLSKLADALGADMSIPATSSKTAAEAMVELTRAGLSVKDVMAAAKPTLLLAAAGMLDNAEAARIVGTALNQFGLAGSQAASVANLLAGAGKNVRGGIEGMAEALNASGVAFHAVNIPIKDAVATLGLLEKNGLLASRAGTTMKEVILKLADPAKKAKEVMQALGINLWQANGAIKPMNEIVQILHDKLGNLNSQQKAFAAGAIGGMRAFQGLAILAKYTGQEFTDYSSKINKAGTIQSEAKSRTDGFAGGMRQLQSAIDNVLKTALTPFLPALTKLVHAISDALAQFNKWPEAARNTTVALFAVAAAAGPVLIALATMKSAWVSLMGAESAAAAEAVTAAATTETATAEAATGVAALGAGAAAAAIPWVGAFAAMGLAVNGLITWLDKTHPAFHQFLLDSDAVGQQFINTITFGRFGDVRKQERFGPLPKGSASYSGGGGDVYGPGGVAGAGPKYSGPEEAAAAAAAAMLGPTRLKNSALQSVMDEQGKKKLTDYQKELADYTSHLADNTIKLISARKGENEATQEVRSTYNLLTAAQQNAIVSSDAQLKKANELIADHKKYADAVKLARTELVSLATTGSRAIAELAKEYPHATAAQLQYLNHLKDTITLQERLHDTATSVARSQEQQRLQQEEYSPVGTTKYGTPLFYSRDQIAAMETYHTHLTNITQAQVDSIKALRENGYAAADQKTYMDALGKDEDDAATAWGKARVSVHELNREFAAQATGSGLAMFALQKYNVVLKDADKATQKMISDDYRMTALFQAKAQLASGLQNVFSNAFSNINQGLKGLFVNIMQGVDDLLTQIAAKFVSAQLVNLLFSLFPGGTNFLSSLMAGGTPGRALGGSVTPGQSYIVGENGPEMFVPSGGGRIVPNNQTRAVLAGGGGNFTINIQTQDAKSFMQSRSQIQSTILQLADAHRRRNGG